MVASLWTSCGVVDHGAPQLHECRQAAAGACCPPGQQHAGMAGSSAVGTGVPTTIQDSLLERDGGAGTTAVPDRVRGGARQEEEQQGCIGGGQGTGPDSAAAVSAADIKGCGVKKPSLQSRRCTEMEPAPPGSSWLRVREPLVQKSEVDDMGKSRRSKHGAAAEEMSLTKVVSTQIEKGVLGMRYRATSVSGAPAPPTQKRAEWEPLRCTMAVVEVRDRVMRRVHCKASWGAAGLGSAPRERTAENEVASQVERPSPGLLTATISGEEKSPKKAVMVASSARASLDAGRGKDTPPPKGEESPQADLLYSTMVEPPEERCNSSTSAASLKFT